MDREDTNDLFDEEHMEGLGGDYQVEVFVDTFKVNNSYNRKVRHFRDEVNEFLGEHNVVQYDMNIEACQYQHMNNIHTKVVHEAWVLYELEEVDGE